MAGLRTSSKPLASPSAGGGGGGKGKEGASAAAWPGKLERQITATTTPAQPWRKNDIRLHSTLAARACEPDPRARTEAPQPAAAGRVSTPDTLALAARRRGQNPEQKQKQVH